MTTREPITLTAAITALIISIVDLVVLIGVWEATADELAGVHLVIGNAAIAVGVWLARGKVTPLTDPRDNTGASLYADEPGH